jgi:hypothetical protein
MRQNPTSVLQAAKEGGQADYRIGWSSRSGTMSLSCLSISPWFSGFSGARVRSEACSPRCIGAGIASTAARSSHCAARKRMSARTKGRNCAGPSRLRAPSSAHSRKAAAGSSTAISAAAAPRPTRIGHPHQRRRDEDRHDDEADLEGVEHAGAEPMTSRTAAIAGTSPP